MIRWSRALESSVDLCSLPSPHRVPRSVPGMAFNFSKIELAHPAAQPNTAEPEENHAGPAVPARDDTSRPSVEIPACSTAR
jgi:hypothetical protein